MSNVGHTGPTAGIAGFIKAVHIARTGTLPPHPAFEQPRDPGLLAESPFVISTEIGHCSDECYVLINSVGMGGSNAAAVLGLPPEMTRAAAPRGGSARLLLSARNRTELDELSRRLADVLDQADLPIADVEHTLRLSRHHFDERRVVVAEPDRLAAALRLPCPPAARSKRNAPPRRAAFVVPPEARLSPEILTLLRAALPPDTDLITDPAAVPDDRFVILAGAGESGEGRYVLSPDPQDLANHACSPREDIMPSLTIRHVTTYRYRQPVALGEHRMTLRPRDSHDQRVIEARLEISPSRGTCALH